MLKIGILISGSGTNMQAIVNACEEKVIDGEVVFVGSDNPEAGGLMWAKERGIPTFSVNYKEIRRQVKVGEIEVPPDSLVRKVFKKTSFNKQLSYGEKFYYIQWKIAAEQQLLKLMNECEFDLVVLAGFMQLCTPFFVDAINTDPERPRIMNIHPALLPAFPGTRGYEDTYDYGCKVGGCTVHFVDYGEDSGPIIGQGVVPIRSGDSLESFKMKGLIKEWEIYPYCIQLFAEGRLKVVERNGRKIVEIILKTETHNSPCAV